MTTVGSPQKRHYGKDGDHGKLKRLIQPTLGFQSMKTAYAAIKGFEVMRMFKKGQFAPWVGRKYQISQSMRAL